MRKCIRCGAVYGIIVSICRKDIKKLSFEKGNLCNEC